MVGSDIIEARDYGLKLASEENLVYINGYNHHDIIAGAGNALKLKFLTLKMIAPSRS